MSGSFEDLGVGLGHSARRLVFCAMRLNWFCSIIYTCGISDGKDVLPSLWQVDEL